MTLEFEIIIDYVNGKREVCLTLCFSGELNVCEK